MSSGVPGMGPPGPRGTRAAAIDARRVRELEQEVARQADLILSLERANGSLRSQNRRYREHAGMLVTELTNAWWLRAADAYAHLQALLRDDLDP